MKYNIGDKVIIKDLKYDETYRGFYVADGISKHCGEVLEIVEVNNLNNSYMLKDCGHWWFNEDMLEPINDSYEYISKETEKTREKTSLEKALELLNMTEEEMNKKYDKKDITELGVEITNKFNNYCNNRWKCRGCKYKEYGKTNCNIMFVLIYLKEKGLLKDEL